MHVHFFYRLFIAFGSHLLFIRHHRRSCLPLGPQLLEGRNTASASRRARRHRRLSSGELHPHPALRPPESHRARGPVPTYPGDRSGKMSWEPAWDAATHLDHAGCARVMGMPWVKLLQSWRVHSQPRQRTHAPSRPPREDDSPPWITVTTPLEPSCPRPALLAPPHIGQPPRRCWLESTQDEQDLGVHHGPGAPEPCFCFTKPPQLLGDRQIWRCARVFSGNNPIHPITECATCWLLARLLDPSGDGHYRGTRNVVSRILHYAPGLEKSRQGASQTETLLVGFWAFFFNWPVKPQGLYFQILVYT